MSDSVVLRLLSFALALIYGFMYTQHITSETNIHFYIYSVVFICATAVNVFVLILLMVCKFNSKFEIKILVLCVSNIA